MVPTTTAVYNHDTFHRDVVRDLSFHGGPKPGERAPDFDLPTTEVGGRFRLSSRLGHRPVLVMFGSLTCPFTLGALDALRDLAPVFAGRIDLVTVYVREMHPGEKHPQPRTLFEKMKYAREWKTLDSISWTVAVDRLDGEVHRAYGLLPAPAFLVDSKGRVAFRCPWSGQRRALRRAMERVLDAEGFGVEETIVGEREVSPLSFVHGAIELKKALARGGAKARHDYRAAMGGVAASVQRLFSGLEDLFMPVHRQRRAA